MKRLFFIGLALIFQFNYLNIVRAEQSDAEYTVGVDDVLEINILQPEKLTSTVTVSSDGSIAMPYIGDVSVKGLSLSKIKEEIETRLSNGYMKYPLVTVLLKESRSRKFFVYGDINKPGVYPMQGETTVLKAISIAGGFSKNSLSTHVKVLRPKNDSAKYESLEVNVRALMLGSANADITIQPQDTVIVSEEKFFVYGDVTKPGVYPMEADTTVLKAISIAGGVVKSGSSTEVKVLRPKENGLGQDTMQVDIKSATQGVASADILLSSGDTVIVSQGKFFVYGEVNHPGVYPLEEGTTVLKAIAMAGGFTKFGSSSRVKLLRAKETGEGYETTRINVKEIMESPSGEDIALKPGDTVVVFEGII